MDDQLLHNLYASRSVFLVDDTATADDWENFEREWLSLTLNNGEEDAVSEAPLNLKSLQSQSISMSEIGFPSDYQYDKIEINFDELLKKYCPKFDLDGELKKTFGSSDDKKTVKSNNEVINTRTGLKYKAPMRGGHCNGSRNNLGALLPNRQDPFRSRQPNTSRPPSVHVDDFYRVQNTDGTVTINVATSASANLVASQHESNGYQSQENRWQSRDDWNKQRFNAPLIQNAPRNFTPVMNIQANNMGTMNHQLMNNRSRYNTPRPGYSMMNQQNQARGDFVAPMAPMPTGNDYRQPRQMERRHSYQNMEQYEDRSRQQQPILNLILPMRYPTPQLQPQTYNYSNFRPQMNFRNVSNSGIMNRRFPHQPFQRPPFGR